MSDWATCRSRCRELGCEFCMYIYIYTNIIFNILLNITGITTYIYSIYRTRTQAHGTGFCRSVGRARVQFPVRGLGVAFFATGPGWVLKCMSFWHSNLPYKNLHLSVIDNECKCQILSLIYSLQHNLIIAHNSKYCRQMRILQLSPHKLSLSLDRS